MHHEADILLHRWRACRPAAGSAAAEPFIRANDTVVYTYRKIPALQKTQQNWCCYRQAQVLDNRNKAATDISNVWSKCIPPLFTGLSASR